MTCCRRGVIAPVVLFLALFAHAAAAQSPSSVDPWRFPGLVGRKPFQRAWWDFQQRAYPLDDLPVHAKVRALQQIQQSRTARPTVAAAGSDRLWFNVGPAPILGGQIGSMGQTRPMSGRVTTIAVDPANFDRWLVGGAQGGIWETSDAGASWTPRTDGQASLAMGALAFAPSNASVAYAGTGEANFSGDSYGGAGLLKSTDGGRTWAAMAGTTFVKNTFSAIKVHPTNPDTLVAAVAYGFAGRGTGFLPLAPPAGVFKSTDGGATWASKLSVAAATDLVVDPGNFSHQYAGVGAPFGGPGQGLYRSTDVGESWALVAGPWSSLPGGVGVMRLAIAPSNPSVLYVSIQDAFNGAGNDGALLGLFRSDNAWAATPTFIQVPNPPSTGALGYCGSRPGDGGLAPQCWYDQVIAVDPVDPNTLYAGGIGLWKCAGCASSPIWTEVSKTASDPAHGIHVDQHALAWAGNRLIVGNDGGVWSTLDGGTTWADHNTTLSLIQFYDGSLHPTDPNVALAGSQDNGTEKWAGGGAWTWIFGGDGAASAISSSRPATDWAVSTQNLQIFRTTNGGASFVQADTGIDHTGAPFIGRFEKCAANDDVFIAGTDNLWKTANFFSAPTPSWSNNQSGSFSPAFISALAFAPADAGCNTYAFGTSDGKLRITGNGGFSWTDIDPGNAVPRRYITDLAFHPADPNTLYVTLSGFDEGTPGRPGHVFKTATALSGSPGWVNASPPVNLPHNTIAIDPSAPEVVYVGTDLGVWKSADGGQNWTHMGPEVGLPNVAVFDLKINAATNRVVAFTHGRGAFALGSTALVSSVLPVSRSVRVNSAATAFAAVVNGGGTAANAVGVSLRSEIPATFSYQITDPGTNTVMGTPNTPVDIAPGQTQTFVIGITPTASLAPTEVEFNFTGNNTVPAETLTGINTLLLSASIAPTPDIVALTATPSADGIVTLPGVPGAAAFSVATVNVGTGGVVTVTTDTGGGNPPVVVSLCRTDPVSGQCASPIRSSVTAQIDAGATPTFAVFVVSSVPIPFAPATNRVFVRFKDAAGLVRGATSVAVRTP